MWTKPPARRGQCAATRFKETEEEMDAFISPPDFTAFSMQEIGVLLFGLVFLFLYRQSQVVYFGLWTVAWTLRFLAALFGYELLRTGHYGWLAPYATFE